MLIQIKDLTDSTPLPNLVSREEINLINQSCEPTRPLERRLVEYKDQSSQTEEILSIVNKKQLFLEYHLVEDRPTEEATQEKLTEDSTTQSKSVVTQTPQKVIIPKKKIKMGFNHIPTYEGDEDPKRHWFVCEKFWDVADITDEDKKMAQFGVSLRHRALTWFMNFTENQNRSKSEIKNSFLTFFKVQDVTHLAAQKLKEIKQRPGESVREYEKDSKIF
jgi:hypothetical protein